MYEREVMDLFTRIKF
jgi:Essential protein Yae1, N terminal